MGLRKNIYLEIYNWLQTFPDSWITYVENPLTPYSPNFLLKYCIVIHQYYALPNRTVYDEEFILVSPTNNVLDSSPVYRKAKAIKGTYLYILKSNDPAGNPWLTYGNELLSNEPKFFCACKPNYGHALLDFLPEYAALNKLIGELEGSFYIGSYPDGSINDLFFILPPKGSIISSGKQINSKVPFPYVVYLAKNVIVSSLRSRAEKVESISQSFTPALKLSDMNEKSGNIIVNRKDKPRISISSSVGQWLLENKFVYVDLVGRPLKDAVAIFSNAKNIILAMGAESSNLIFSDEDTVAHLLVNCEQLRSPYYMNAITDTVLPITRSSINIVPLQPLEGACRAGSMTDAALNFNTTDIIGTYVQ